MRKLLAGASALLVVAVASAAQAADVSIQVGPGGFMAPGVPEPQTWAMMIAGLGLMGVMLRRRRAVRSA